MKDFQSLLPPSKSAKPAKPSFTMEDVRASVGTSYYLKQCLRTLQSHLGDMPLSLVPGTEDWFIESFPKPKGSIHPRPDLKQKIEPYMKWRQEVLRAIRLANGEAEAKKKRGYRDDSWKKILDARKLHSSGGGIIYKSAGGPVSSLADLCRTAGIGSWDLEGETALKRIEDAIAAHRSADRPVIRSALAFLEIRTSPPRRKKACWLSRRSTRTARGADQPNLLVCRIGPWTRNAKGSGQKAEE